MAWPAPEKCGPLHLCNLLVKYMWPFTSKQSIEESGILQGLTDWHSHILPGVDDGIKTLDDSLEALGEYERLGVADVWLTPHIMEDYPNETALLKDRFENLKSAWTGKTRIHLAAENMLDSLFEQRLEANDFLPIGEKGKHLLVETSYLNPPYGMEEMLEGVFNVGLTPVLAHPERYRYMDEQDYIRLKQQGIIFQINYLSVVGGYGETARKKSHWLLKKGMANLLGSDIHKLSFVKRMIAHADKKEPVAMLAQVGNTLDDF